MWARSYLRADLVRLDAGDRRTTWLVETARGRVQVGIASEWLPEEDLPRSYLSHASAEPSDIYPLPHRLLGIGWGRRVDLPPWINRRAAIDVHLGYLVILFALWPFSQAYRRLRNRRVPGAGHCAGC